jgi:ribosomal protein S1
MSAPTVKPGDAVRMNVTKVLPFAVLVETAAGLPGLVRHVGPQHGDVITVTVTAVDDEQQRFSGTVSAS